MQKSSAFSLSVESDFASNADQNAPITGLDFCPVRSGVLGTNQAAAYGGLEKVYIVHTWVVSSNFQPVKTALRHTVSTIRIRACNYRLLTRTVATVRLSTVCNYMP